MTDDDSTVSVSGRTSLAGLVIALAVIWIGTAILLFLAAEFRSKVVTQEDCTPYYILTRTSLRLTHPCVVHSLTGLLSVVLIIAQRKLRSINGRLLLQLSCVSIWFLYVALNCFVQMGLGLMIYPI